MPELIILDDPVEEYNLMMERRRLIQMLRYVRMAKVRGNMQQASDEMGESFRRAGASIGRLMGGLNALAMIGDEIRELRQKAEAEKIIQRRKDKVIDLDYERRKRGRKR